MRRNPYLLSMLALNLSVACTPQDKSQAEGAGNPAYAWHDSVMAAMGGMKAWKSTQYLQFRWNVFRGDEVVSDRLHRWAVHDGRYRLETTREGESLVVLLDINSQEGEAWLDGESVEGAEKDSLAEFAYARFINDSYWMLMPYKWRDPGVNLEYLGRETHDDGTWQVFHLDFDEVGLTPGDQYWAYISDTPPHLMRKWQYHLQGRESKGPVIRWENWQQFGPIRLATQRNPVDADFRIEFAQVEAAERVPPGVFDAPRAQ